MARHVKHQHSCGFDHICVRNWVWKLGECQEHHPTSANLWYFPSMLSMQLGIRLPDITIWALTSHLGPPIMETYGSD